jgi:uncharacterized protein YciI
VIYHVRFTCADDYNARRLPYRPAHLKQLTELSRRGLVVAGGPEPAGDYANIFYDVPDRAALDALLVDNEFNRAGLFVGSLPRAFTEFLAPIERPPLDTAFMVTIVEGTAADRAKAREGMIELRRTGEVAFGGLFDGDAALVIVRHADVQEAQRIVAKAGGWVSEGLSARPWSQTL